MRGSSPALSTASSQKHRAKRAALSKSKSKVPTGPLSLTAWERVLDQLRMKLPERPSRTTVFGLAGLRYGKMYWMRRNPDLRSSVIVKLSRALKVKPEEFLRLMVRESKTDPLGEIRW